MGFYHYLVAMNECLWLVLTLMLAEI